MKYALVSTNNCTQDYLLEDAEADRLVAAWGESKKSRVALKDVDNNISCLYLPGVDNLSLEQVPEDENCVLIAFSRLDRGLAKLFVTHEVARELTTQWAAQTKAGLFTVADCTAIDGTQLNIHLVNLVSITVYPVPRKETPLVKEDVEVKEASDFAKSPVGWRNTLKEKYKPVTEKEKLGYLVEECGEVLAAAGKTLRWGSDSVNPELPTSEQETNEDWLLRELHDLQHAIDIIRMHYNLAGIPE